ncbi:MAG: hypothetical protein FD124_2264 [Alphaproteobacteria bacterium]|nr:MAG: hypothetical protein FD160_2732 [Caulobacteraceae bacterium]TPW05199.1 MAG: hypothetical protein FD124_2264 [Alphaproteobacteria bacterium]
MSALACNPCTVLAGVDAARPALAIVDALDGGGFTIPWLRIALAAVFGVSATVVAVLALRRSGKGALIGGLRWPGLARTHAGEHIEVIEVRRISLHADVCRLSSGGREYLVVVGAGGVELLRERPLDPPDELGPAELGGAS